MSGIEKIITRITSEAEKEASVIVEEARAKAEQMLRDTQQEAARLKEQLSQKNRENAELRLQRARTAEETVAKKALLSEKQAILAEVFERAEAALCALPENSAIEFLAKTAAAASRTGREELILSPEDYSRFGQRVLAAALPLLSERGLPCGMSLSAEPRELEGGGGIVLRDGNVEINCSFGALIAGIKNDVTPEAARILFG